MTTPLDKVLNRLVKTIKMKHVNVIDVKEYLNVYDVDLDKNIKNSISIRPLYRVCFATTMNGEDIFTIYDSDMVIERGKNEIAMEIIKRSGVLIKDGHKALANQDSWKDRAQGKLVKSCLKLDVKDFFEMIKAFKVAWVDFLNYLIDDTGKKDERIINVAKATYLSACEINNFFASINNHSLIVSNSGVGKSTTFSRLTGRQPETDYSIPGLIGTVQEGRITGGSLNGKGLYVFDEFPQTNESRSMVVASLLNYMESGETIRDLAQRIYCKGAKTLVFMGNIPRDWNEKNFEEVLLKLAGQDAFQRVGRRMAHILFRPDFKEINPSHENVVYVNFLRYVLESAVSQNQQKIKKIYTQFNRWLLEEDKSYIDTIKSFSKYSSFKLVGQFLDGNSRAYSRIKNGALKWALIENLDKICSDEISFKELVSYLRVETNNRYEILKRYNYESYEFLLEGKKAKVVELHKSGKSDAQIADELEISDHTVKKWIRDYSSNIQNGLEDSTIYKDDINELRAIRD
jgi:DNA-binding CsgD family transcriptional regulator